MGVVVTDLHVFDFKGHRVRTAGTLEAPLFCASDSCDALTIADASDALERLDQDDVVVVVPAENGSQRVLVRGPNANVYVTEPGLYELIIRSNKPAAKEFKRWVTHEVLPEIRKRGYYSFVAQERKRLLAEYFPELPGPAVPLFSDLLDALLVKFGWVPRNTNHPTKPKVPRRSPAAPPWTKQLASDVYRWAIRVDGQQQFRRVKNPAPKGGSPKYPDHSMFGGATKDAVREVCRTGVHFLSAGTPTWEHWKLQMELAFGNKPKQLPFIGPIGYLRPSGEAA
jgi:prophage antirepressor-like protein